MKRILLSFIILLPEVLWSQSFYAIRNQRKYILTGGTGTATYYGELSNPGTFIKLQPNLNLGLMKYVSPNIGVRIEANWFILQGSDNQASEVGRKLRGLSFRSSCFELTAVGEISLYSNGTRYYRRPTINFYALAGIGLLYFNPVADYKGKAYSLEPLHTEGVSYSRVSPVIPIGLGVRFKVSPNVNIALEGGYRKTFTDYLDDVSSRYISPTGDPIRDYFINPTNNVPGLNSKRGNPSRMDSYFLLNAKIEYYLPLQSYRKSNGLVNKRKSKYRYNKRGGIRR
jgi:hypothetical protein